jgi:hypothetical protein
MYFENHMKGTRTLCGQNIKLYNVKAVGTYSNHCALKAQLRFKEYKNRND